MTTASFFLFIILFIFVNPSQSDLCNFHGTLFETETFYITQPYSHNISIDLGNYQSAFSTFSQKLDTFSNLLRLYESDAQIRTQEPLPLIPFSSDTNIFKSPKATTGKEAFLECASNNGALLAITNENRGKAIEIMKDLQLEKVPFYSLPNHYVFSYPGLEILDKSASSDVLEAVWAKTPIFLRTNNTFEFPLPITFAPPETTTASVGKKRREATTTTKAPLLENQLHFSLCTKPNNPWDREPSRKNWLKLTPQIRNSIKYLQELYHNYLSASNTLSKLPSSTVSDIARNIKLVLPEPLKAIIDFIDKFSSKQNWESTKPDALSLFSTFVRNTFKAMKLFNLETSISNIKSKPTKRFRLLNFNDLHWKDLFDLNEEQFGISGPVSVTPFDRLTQDNHFLANVRFRIFDRQLDKHITYKFRPNIIDRLIIDIHYVLKTHKYTLASKEDIIPHDCHSQQTELHRICHKLPSHAFEPKHHSVMTECGSALLSPDYDKKHAFCPLIYPSSDPILYRADCQNDDHSSLIVSSTKNISLAIVCDGIFKNNTVISVSPSKIFTDCEARVLGSTEPGMIVPQRNPDLYQDPFLGSIFPYLQPSNIPSSFNYLLYVVAPVATGILLVLVAMLAFCLHRCFKTPENELAPVRSGTFRVYSTNPSMIELSNFPQNRDINSRLNSYPLLN